MSHSLEGFSLPYMKEITIQDLDSYQVSFKQWVTYLNNLYKKPNSWAKFFGMFFPQQADKSTQVVLLIIVFLKDKHGGYIQG